MKQYIAGIVLNAIQVGLCYLAYKGSPTAAVIVAALVILSALCAFLTMLTDTKVARPLGYKAFCISADFILIAYCGYSGSIWLTMAALFQSAGTLHLWREEKNENGT